MILIADSGSTKTDWCYGTETTNCKIVQTEGINPFHQSEERYGLSSMMNFFHNWTPHSSAARLFTSMAPMLAIQNNLHHSGVTRIFSGR